MEKERHATERRRRSVQKWKRSMRTRRVCAKPKRPAARLPSESRRRQARRRFRTAARWPRFVASFHCRLAPDVGVVFVFLYILAVATRQAGSMSLFFLFFLLFFFIQRDRGAASVARLAYQSGVDVALRDSGAPFFPITDRRQLKRDTASFWQRSPRAHLRNDAQCPPSELLIRATCAKTPIIIPR